MLVHILGMNGPFPAADGACSGYLAEAGSCRIQLDLGSGTLAALSALMPPESLTALVFSHWHYDHCSDVLPLLYRLQNAPARLTVYGPADDASPIRRLLQEHGSIELHTLEAGDSVALPGGVRLEACAAVHPVPALMLRLRTAGHTLCYTGDTNRNPALVDFARDADLLLADGMFPLSAWKPQLPHMAAAQAAQAAAEAGVKRLVITHLYPAFSRDLLLQEAREAFPSAELASCGSRFAW